MNKSTKKKLWGAVWTAGAVVLGLVVWTLADGESRTRKAKNQLKQAA